MKKKIKWGFVSVVILLLAVLFFLNNYNFKDNNEIKSADNIKIKETNTYKNKIIDYQNQYNNQDIIAELVIDDLKIDTLITKTGDNNFYLNHDIYRNENPLGNPYVDFRNDNDLKDERQINIYSHNSDYSDYQEKLPFYNLEKYLDKNTFDKSGNIYLYTEDVALVYKVVAIKIITTDNEHTVLDSGSNERWGIHLDRLLSDTKYCAGDCKLEVTDKLLVLQTCNYNPRGSYIILISKQVKGEKNNEK